MLMHRAVTRFELECTLIEQARLIAIFEPLFAELSDCINGIEHAGVAVFYKRATLF